MEKYLSDNNFDYYRTTIQAAQRNFGYQFQVKDGNGAVNLAGVEVNNLELTTE